MKKSAVVIFPGRGTYGKDELGYLNRFHGDKGDFIANVDQWREAQNRETVSALDSAKAYAASKHASSVNASAIIYTCALADFADIDREKFDITAVCGNSLGWVFYPRRRRSAQSGKRHPPRRCDGGADGRARRRRAIDLSVCR